MSAAAGAGTGRAGSAAPAVREARPADLPRIWELLLELAGYEKLGHLTTGTPEKLGRHLFGDAWPRVECLVAESGGEIVGYALFFGCFSSFWTAPLLWLEDLYVTGSLRGRGVGRVLLAELARIAVERGCPRVGWAVLDWNAPAMEFYRRLGATRSAGWMAFELAGERLAALAAESGSARATGAGGAPPA